MKRADEQTVLLEVSQADAPVRLDQCLLIKLRESWPTLSRSKLKEAFQSEQIRLRGRKADASILLAAGPHEIILVGGWQPTSAQEAQKALPSPQGAFLAVIHEDERLLVLNKESGIPSVPHSAAETHTAVSSALAHWPGLAQVGRAGLEPGLLHRLDTGTSGLLAFAKTSAEFERLRLAWTQHRVCKIYRALAARPALDTALRHLPAELQLFVGHDGGSTRRMKVLGPVLPSAWELKQIRGKPLPTLTRIREIKGPSEASFGDFEIEIETGVMHQIRCVLAWSGCPILGDPIYGGAPSERLWLHAWQLVLPLENGGKLQLEAPLPEGWRLAP